MSSLSAQTLILLISTSTRSSRFPSSSTWPSTGSSSSSTVGSNFQIASSTSSSRTRRRWQTEGPTFLSFSGKARLGRATLPSSSSEATAASHGGLRDYSSSVSLSPCSTPNPGIESHTSKDTFNDELLRLLSPNFSPWETLVRPSLHLPFA
jgi:hypothetical protein